MQIDTYLVLIILYEIVMSKLSCISQCHFLILDFNPLNKFSPPHVALTLDSQSNPEVLHFQ